MTLNYAISLSGGGRQISRSKPRSPDGEDSRQPELAPAKGGTLTTRGSNTAGTITMTSGGHGISTSQVVDVYWSGGMRFGVTVGTVSGTAVPITGGSGDNLPSTSTVMAVCPRTKVTVSIDGDLLSVIGVDMAYIANPTATAYGHIDGQDSADGAVADIDLPPNTALVWDIAGGATNPFTGAIITQLYVSHGNIVDTATLKLIWGGDTTP